MPKLIKEATVIKPVGNKPKIIREFVGAINSNTSELSIAHMTSSKGWKEPGQCPDFDEYTLVLKGELMVESKDKELKVLKGEAVIAYAKEWIRYSTPNKDTEYIAVCVPAFSNETVHRDEL